jgi:sugar lactone lactonase YvrE
VVVSELGSPTDGDIFISDYADGSLYRIDPSRGVKVKVASGLGNPEGMVIDPEGILYIGGVFTGVKRFDTITGNFLPNVATNVCQPDGLSIDSNGDLFTNTRQSPCGHSGVWKVAGRTAQTAVQVIPPFTSWGEGTAFLQSGVFAGQLLAVDRTNGRVVRSIPPSFGAISNFIIGLSTPLGVAVSPTDGDVYVGERGQSRIVRYDSAGSFKSVFATGLSNAAFFAFDTAGNLIVGDGDQLLRFAPDGTWTILATGLSEIAGVAVAKFSTALSPNLTPLLQTGGDTGPVTVRIRGAGFQQGAEVLPKS